VSNAAHVLVGRAAGSSPNAPARLLARARARTHARGENETCIERGFDRQLTPAFVSGAQRRARSDVAFARRAPVSAPISRAALPRRTRFTCVRVDLSAAALLRHHGQQVTGAAAVDFASRFQPEDGIANFRSCAT
jgi:hypothetical protein